MATFYPQNDEQSRQRWSIVDALRRYGQDAAKVGHRFAAKHRLQPVDLEALVAILAAEGAGEPLTPGRLTARLGLSSAGTSYVIDRLVKSGHVRRSREDSADKRVVHLRYTRAGQATAMAFFGPLGQRTDAVIDRFSAEELTVIERFLSAIATATREHIESLEQTATDPHRRPATADAENTESMRDMDAGGRRH